MQIHVVQSGDSLYNIARTYHVAVDTLITANELATPDQLVVGQTLVIPIIGQFYFIQPNDTLTMIAQKFGISPAQLAAINHISMNQTLQVGMRLYIPPLPKSEITSLGYVEPMGDSVSEILKNAVEKTSPKLTFLSLFSYTMNRDGTLNSPPQNNLKQIATANKTAMSMAITNIEEGSFSTELIHIILTVQAVQNNLLDQIVNTALTNEFREVHFDFEFIQPEDREAYNLFLRKAKDRLSQAGLLMSTALAPKTSATQEGLLYEAHDYKAHGEIADFVVLMTYEWGYSAGPPLPVSPIDQVRRVVDYALTEIPADKILLGQNLYGYDWTLPFVPGGELARAISPQQAIDIARQFRAEIQYDYVAQAPFFKYTDQQGRIHEVWFEDARSIQAKFDLIKEKQLRGIAYWKLGLAFPQNWLLLGDNFTIRKI
ncbi:LysM peptidoglycan-binding domain-containing protein [Ornithinibacillus sp. 4-3]|uniref:LysM peptidoglycan-binding domain-containing protein n=1 Tax=Ornithinibacillus sp. 4-3 TaxID=3231488 RepID=A0AB39HQ36_9BACI